MQGPEGVASAGSEGGVLTYYKYNLCSETRQHLVCCPPVAKINTFFLPRLKAGVSKGGLL